MVIVNTAYNSDINNLIFSLAAEFSSLSIFYQLEIFNKFSNALNIVAEFEDYHCLSWSYGFIFDDVMMFVVLTGKLIETISVKYLFELSRNQDRQFDCRQIPD